MEDVPQRPSGDQLQAFGRAVGVALKLARESRKWSVYRLSEESGVDERGIHRIEEGNTSPSVDTLLRITSAMGVRLSSLFAEAEVETCFDQPK